MHLEELSERTLQEASAIADGEFPDEHVLPSESFAASLGEKKREYLKKVAEMGTHITDFKYWVAVDDDGKVLGTTGLYSIEGDGDEARWLGWYCVSPAARGQGVGSALLDFSIQQTREQGKRILRLYTSNHPDEAAAQDLFEKKGLKVVKEQDVEDEYEGYRRRIREIVLSKKVESKETLAVETRRIDNPGDPEQQKLLMEAYALMKETFSSGEIEEPETLARSIRDWGYGFFVAVDTSTERVVGFASGTTLSLSGEEGIMQRTKIQREGADEEFVYGAYIVVNTKQRGRSIGSTIFRARMQGLEEDITARGNTSLGYFAEVSSDDEEFFDRVGAKRLYVKTGRDANGRDVYEEIPYVAAPLRFDKRTGQGIVVEEDGKPRPFKESDAPARLMFAPAEGQPQNMLEDEKLMKMADVMREYNAEYLPGEMEGGERGEAAQAADRILLECRSKLESFIQQAQDGVVHLFSDSERAKLEAKGKTFIDHKLS